MDNLGSFESLGPLVRCFCAGLWLTVLSLPSQATLVRPTSFEQLTDQADLVFAGRVITNYCAWSEVRGRRLIVTRVSFDVCETYKGSSPGKIELQFLGGAVGQTRLEVEGTPEFPCDERVLLFVRTNIDASCPVVGYFHGKLSIRSDAVDGKDTLVRNDSQVVTHLSQIGRGNARPPGVVLKQAPAVQGAGGGSSPLTLEDLKAAVRARLATRTLPTVFR